MQQCIPNLISVLKLVYPHPLPMHEVIPIDEQSSYHPLLYRYQIPIAVKQQFPRDIYLLVSFYAEDVIVLASEHCAFEVLQTQKTV